MKFGSLPSQLKRLPKLRSLRISAANLNLARLFIGMAAMRGLRSVTINMAGRDKKTAEQGLPDDIMMPLATHTGAASSEHLLQLAPAMQQVGLCSVSQATPSRG